MNPSNIPPHSAVFKAPALSAPSPNGLYLALPTPTHLQILSSTSLLTLHETPLSTGLSASLINLQWSSSSDVILLATQSKIHLYSVPPGRRATVSNAGSTSAQPGHLGFLGPWEVLSFSSYGLNVALVDFATSKSVEILNPKFYTAPSAPRGYSLRSTGHLALLTRIDGKDTVSIHPPSSRDKPLTFSPATVDAQGVFWVASGRWLAVWESPAQGHKLLLYTPDGHLFYEWTGPEDDPLNPAYTALAPGVRHFHVSKDTNIAAICDSSSTISIMDLETGTPVGEVTYPTYVTPSDTLFIWQEQRHTGSPPTFIPAEAALSAPVTPPTTPHEPTTGCHLTTINCSKALLASIPSANKTTLYIWQLEGSTVHTMMIFFSPITSVTWHPREAELLLITTAEAVYTWEPSSTGPQSVPHEAILPAPASGGKPPRVKATWVGEMVEPVMVFVTYAGHGVLIAVGDEAERGNNMWGNESLASRVIHGEAGQVIDVDGSFDAGIWEGDGSMSMDDTFEFIKNR